MSVRTHLLSQANAYATLLLQDRRTWLLEGLMQYLIKPNLPFFLQQEAALQAAVAQGQECERLLLDQHQQVCLSRSVI